MYALIYDEYDLAKPRKMVISVHRSRETADQALEKRMKTLGKRVWECNTRIVWAKVKVARGDHIRENDFEIWRPGEKIPHGEMYSDSD
ncbi:MAG: hypothetical protein JJV98_05325 [Desulfosarcina sp.]|nr:hypothetical protein [Desulfobacterales bacterium]